MKRYIRCSKMNMKIGNSQMTKSNFIKKVLMDVHNLQRTKNNASRWGDTVYVVSKDKSMFERWTYDMYNDPSTKQFLTKFYVDSNNLGHTSYPLTDWVDHSHRVDSSIKEFLEREVGKSFIVGDEIVL